jgi:hypothetical protein
VYILTGMDTRPNWIAPFHMVFIKPPSGPDASLDAGLGFVGTLDFSRRRGRLHGVGTAGS